MFGHVLQLRLRAVEKAFSAKTARANGYLALVNVIAHTLEVFLQSQQHIDARTLIRLEHVVQRVVGSVEEQSAAQRKEGYPQVVLDAHAQPLPHQIADEHNRDDELHPHHIEGDDIDGEQQRQQRDAQTGAQNAQRIALVVTIDIDHERRE